MYRFLLATLGLKYDTFKRSLLSFPSSLPYSFPSSPILTPVAVKLPKFKGTLLWWWFVVQTFSHGWYSVIATIFEDYQPTVASTIFWHRLFTTWWLWTTIWKNNSCISSTRDKENSCEWTWMGLAWRQLSGKVFGLRKDFPLTGLAGIYIISVTSVGYITLIEIIT